MTKKEYTNLTKMIQDSIVYHDSFLSPGFGKQSIFPIRGTQEELEHFHKSCGLNEALMILEDFNPYRKE